MPNGTPWGFGDLGRMAIYFQGAGGALVIILGELVFLKKALKPTKFSSL